ncbi:MAG: carbon-nitrogen hydrolase family protein [Thermoplasmata archaeon]|nr:MAG: carbon-nitrogen hydrolase family protein [Thermoplasmata archaeon]
MEMIPSSLDVEIIQRFHGRFDVPGNAKIIADAIRSSESRLLIFPEMFITGYTLGSEIRHYAMDPGNEVFGELKDLAAEHGKHLIFGFPESSNDIKGQIFNSAMIMGPEGVVGTYRKMHLVDFGPFEEWAYFTPGNAPFMFSIDQWKIGVIICYDIFFPELVKHYALNGADLVVCISASPSLTRKYFELVMKARAVENTIYFAYSNMVGFDSRMDFWGGGELIDPRGNTIAKGPYFEEASVSARIDEDLLRSARASRPTLRDTKPHISEFISEWGHGSR